MYTLAQARVAVVEKRSDSRPPLSSCASRRARRSSLSLSFPSLSPRSLAFATPDSPPCLPTRRNPSPARRPRPYRARATRSRSPSACRPRTRSTRSRRPSSSCRPAGGAFTCPSSSTRSSTTVSLPSSISPRGTRARRVGLSPPPPSALRGGTVRVGAQRAASRCSLCLVELTPTRRPGAGAAVGRAGCLGSQGARGSPSSHRHAVGDERRMTTQRYDIGILRSAVFEVSQTMSNSFSSLPDAAHPLLPARHRPAPHRLKRLPSSMLTMYSSCGTQIRPSPSTSSSTRRSCARPSARTASRPARARRSCSRSSSCRQRYRLSWRARCRARTGSAMCRLRFEGASSASPAVRAVAARASPRACNYSLLMPPLLLPLCLRAYRSILTASYAGTLSLQSNDLPPGSNLTFTGHDLSALSATYVPVPLGSEDKRWVASGGMDRVGRVWEYSVRRPSPSSSRPRSCGLRSLQCSLAFLDTDPAPLSRRRADRPRPGLPLHPLAPPSAHLVRPLPPAPCRLDLGNACTAPPHGGLGRPHRSVGPGAGLERGRGRPRGRRQEEEAPASVDDRHQQGACSPPDVQTRTARVWELTLSCALEQVPSAVLRGHSGKISRALFDRSDVTKAYSAGWDHTVRSWDLSVGEETSSKVRPLPACPVLPLTSSRR